MGDPDRQPKFYSPEIMSYFVAGGVAGATSRTVVSPLERLKIIQQVQPRASKKQYKGVWTSLVRMWKEEGFKGYMRGNGVNCLRIVPYSAVQFTTYEQVKKFFIRDGTSQLDTPKRLASGALAGIASVCTTYPLDLVRARLSIATASIPMQNVSPPPAVQPHWVPSNPSSDQSIPSSHSSHRPKCSNKDLTIIGMTIKIMREEGGIRALYRGLIPTALGVAPYVGINFAAYEWFRGIITPPGKNTVGRRLLCGALSGAISQTLTYPLDVLRRKMQVIGMEGARRKRNGAVDALVSIIRTEGFRGMYRGLWPNLLKVAPSIATSFFTYEFVKEHLIIPQG